MSNSQYHALSGHASGTGLGGGRDMVASAFPRGRASNRMSLIGMTSPGTYPDWKQSVPGLHPLLSYGEGDGLVRG